MEADFSGWATKAGLKCKDGRTIMPDAFKHQDTMKVPLVWQHGHTDPENVLGHAILENRAEGVYCYGFFNNSNKAQATREALEHKDINSLSIWANDLIERAGRVMHGVIREVSVVLSGANPGALIENVSVRHSDGDIDELDDEVIIYTGLPIEHEGLALAHAEGEDDETVEDVFNTLSDKQKQVVYYMIGQALEDAGSGGTAAQSGMDLDDDPSIEDVYNSMNDQQKEVLHYMIGEALEGADDTIQHDGVDDDDNNENKTGDDDTETKGNEMKHNVFESGAKENEPVISHADIEGIVADATKSGSLKDAVESYALAHGIDNIDILFPEARTLTNTPEFFARRNEWVNKVLGGARKSPFSRVKTMAADITVEEARAKGYVKGALKKEEFFAVSRRITTPTTIYKKQKLDRDDIIDITDFDVVTWLKGEMRIMLDEEIARAILIGDGRVVDHEDKINETNIRPIARDHELYTTVVNVNLDDEASNMGEVVDAIILNRSQLRGTGMPTLFTTETFIARFMLLKDNIGRRLYKNLQELATELRVSEIVPVEVLEDDPEIVAILVNMADYTVGADQGGQVSMFDDFDIDYNQHKYLIETRMSGALSRLKAAMVVKRVAGTDTLVVPAAPAFDGDEITITDQAGVEYRNAADDSLMTAAGSPYAVADGEVVTVNAFPTSGNYFPTSEDDSWTFTGQ